MHSKTAAILATATLVGQAAAHGYVRTWTLDGVDFNGYSRSDGSPKAGAIGWSFTTPDEGPEMNLNSPNFACRSGGKSASSSGQIAAGGQANFFWTSDDHVINPNGWNPGHRGPIMTYIASCNGDCSSVDAGTLKWTKIAEEGVTGPANTQGTWATDNMVSNGGVASATIPSDIAAGNYVLRNEIIALHKAHLGEPEFYMQCGNVEVTGAGTDDLSGAGVAASLLYSTVDTQIYGFSIYDNRGDGSEWIVPGGALYSGAGSSPPTTGTPSNGTTPGTKPPPASPPIVTGSPVTPSTPGNTDYSSPPIIGAPDGTPGTRPAPPSQPPAPPAPPAPPRPTQSYGGGHNGPWRGGRPSGSWKYGHY